MATVILNEPRVGWVLYDEDCGLCSRWARSLRPTLERRGFAVAPLQSPWVQERTGLELGELVTDLRLLLVDGGLLAGANAYRYAMRRIWWAYPIYLLSNVPGLARVFDWGYRTFADNRMRISASCGLPRRIVT